MSLMTVILRHNRIFGVIGVSQEPVQYGRKIYETLQARGYRIPRQKA